MKYRANSNQMTDEYGLVPAGQIIPDGALSEASIQKLLAVGLVTALPDDEVVAEPPKEG